MKLFFIVLFYSLSIMFAFGCENLHKPHSTDDDLSFTNLFLIGTTIKTNTYVRIINERSVPISAAIYDNSSCDPNSAPRYTGQQVVYDFGTVPANSKSEIKALPLMNYPIESIIPQSERVIEFYTKVNFLCERNSFYISTISDQIGYIWRVVAPSATSYYSLFEIRKGSLITPYLE